MGSSANQPASTSSGSSFPPKKFSPALSPLFFAALFFLCSADLVFTTRIHGFNFRWGQFLLLAVAVSSIAHLFRQDGPFLERRSLLKQVVLAWAPFSLVYVLAACLSGHPALGLLKFGWAAFNLGGAALVVLGGPWPSALQKGFRWGILLLAATVLLQSLCLFVFPGFFQVTGDFALSSSYFLKAHPFGLAIPLGVGQFIANWGPTTIYRPCAFYYEPNYLSGALALALPLLLLQERGTRWTSGWAPGLVITAVILTTSRGGILGCAFTLAALGTAALLGPLREKRALLFKSILFAGIGAGLFLLSKEERLFLGYLSGSLGPAAIQQHALTPHTSEGERVLSFLKDLQSILTHPWLGQGYQPITNSSGMAPGSLNTWVEIGMESGFLGLLGFLFGVFYTLRVSLPGRMGKGTRLVLLAAGIVLFGINYNLSSNFPRLDYWLLFFYSILLAGTAASEQPLDRA